MPCLHPLYVTHPRLRSLAYKKARFDFEQAYGVLTDSYESALFSQKIYVPCGRCLECRKKRAGEWRTRLLHELETSHNVIFVTLTIAPEFYSGEDTPIKEYLRKFFFAYRWRYRDVNGKHAKVPKHFFITELGELKGRLHLHGFIFDSQLFVPSTPSMLCQGVRYSKGKRHLFNPQSTELLQQLWPYGRVEVAYSSSFRSISYVTKYLLKPCKYDSTFISRIFCSPGIGKNWFQRILPTIRRALLYGEDTDVPSGRHTCPLPRYYRDVALSREDKICLEDRRLANCQNDTRPFRAWFNGIEYRDEVAFAAALSNAYKMALRANLYYARPPRLRSPHIGHICDDSYDLYMSRFENVLLKNNNPYVIGS